MTTRRFLSICAAATALLTPQPRSAVAETEATDPTQEWPQWLGPHRNGTSGVTGLQRQWPADGPVEVWRRPLGEGFSSIAVAGGAVYTMLSDDSGEYIVSLDASDGGERWRVRSGDHYIERQGGNGPRCTPTVDGDIVFALGASGELHALRAATGEIVWKRDLQMDFGGERPTWGFSGSPLVEGDLLLLETGGSKGRALAALDKHSGNTVWTGLENKIGYSSPIAATVAGLRQVLFFTAAGLVALAPADGSVYWQYPWRTPYDVNAATPVFIPPNRVFLSTGYDVGAGMIEVSGSAESLQAISVWRNKAMKNKMATTVHRDGYLYGLDNAILKCVDAASGADRWKARGHGMGSLIWADGLLIVLSDKGRLALVKADPSGYSELAGAQVLDGLCWTAPSLANGRAYLRDMTQIVCLQLAATGD